MIPVDYARVAAHDAPHEHLYEAAQNNVKSDQPAEPLTAQCVGNGQDVETDHYHVDYVGDLGARRLRRRASQAPLAAKELRERAWISFPPHGLLYLNYAELHPLVIRVSLALRFFAVFIVHLSLRLLDRARCALLWPGRQRHLRHKVGDQTLS